MFSSRAFASEPILTRPSGLGDLKDQSTPSGQIEVRGHATYRGIRVSVLGLSPRGSAVGIAGPLSLPDLQFRHDDIQTGSSSGDVPFDALDQFWLTRTTTAGVVTNDSPRPGVFATVDGVDVGVTDTCGTVAPDGTPQIQLMRLTESTSSGDEWVRDGHGQWARMERRDPIATVRHVEWMAVWRGLTAVVASITGDKALIFAARGSIPASNMPEIARTSNVRSGWSAVVPLGELNLRSWTSVERPLGSGCVAGNVGLVGGRTVRVARAPGDSADGAVLIAHKLRGETVTDKFVVHPRTRRVDSAWEWRAGVDEADLHGIQRISATTTWKGQTRAVMAYREPEGLVYFENETAPIAETTPLVYQADTILPGDLPLVSALG
jgi:hypothetical protein